MVICPGPAAYSHLRTCELGYPVAYVYPYPRISFTHCDPYQLSVTHSKSDSGHTDINPYAHHQPNANPDPVPLTIAATPFR